MPYRGASEEEFGRGYGTGGYSDGGAIAAQINRGTDQIRDDLRAGGEALRDSNRNYFQNLGGAVEKGFEGYERGKRLATEEEQRARENERFGMEKQRFGTEEEAAKQNREKGQMEIEGLRRRGLSEEAQENILNQTDPKTGMTLREQSIRSPLAASEEQIASSRAGRKNEDERLGMEKDRTAREIAANKKANADAALAAQVSARIMATPDEQMDVEGQRIMASLPPEKQAAAFKAIGDARAQKFSQTLAQNSTPQGQMKVELHKAAYKALSDATELRGKLNTFMNNRFQGGIDIGLGEIPLAMRNDVANNSLEEIAAIIGQDGTPQAQKLAEKLTSPYRMDSSVISEVNAYIAAKEQETKNFVNKAGAFFPAGEKDEFQKSLMHLTKDIGGDKRRPPAKTLTTQQAGGFLTGFAPDAPEQQYQVQPVSTGAGLVPPQVEPQQGMPQGQPATQASPMPAVPKPKSPLELKYGKRR